jgi:aminoglycoside/choline kinase family phosphotransferase
MEMNKLNEAERIGALYRKFAGHLPAEIEALPVSGSNRTYFRIVDKEETVVGSVNPDIREHKTFIAFTRAFEKAGFPVPEILADEPLEGCCLLTDLGNQSLFELLSVVDPGVVSCYQKAIAWLPRFQIEAPKILDFSLCYPRHAFDRQSMQWDLNYFKYYYLKLAGIPFHEQELEEDYQHLIDWLLQAPSEYFLYRDFQSRNIMIVNGDPWFIDYQGGRKGALPYDVASLLYDAKANLPEIFREDLLNHYLDALEPLVPGSRDAFIRFLPGFVLIRILQAMGAYGYRGFYEGKTHFLKSVPYALANLRNLLESWDATPELKRMVVLKEVVTRVVEDGDRFKEPGANATHPKNSAIRPKSGTIHPKSDAIHPKSPTKKLKSVPDQTLNDPGIHKAKLTVSIHSFSYKKGVPEDLSDNGGGFIFDCRALPNPGREDRFKPLSGLDQPVIGFLEQDPEVNSFLEHVFALISQSVTVYTRRGFNNLQVSFGCTGGQHRSVYCAEKLARYLDKYHIKTKINHENMDAWR